MKLFHWITRKNKTIAPDPDLERERELLHSREVRANRVVGALGQLRERNQFREQILMTVQEALHER